MNAEYDEPVAFMNIIKILSDFQKFRKWLKEYHKIKNDKKFLKGYKYLILTSTQWFIETLAYYDPFRLKDDKSFERSHFIGKPFEDIPNSSEKIIFCKNIWELTKPIRNSSTWTEMEQTKDLKEIIRILDIVLRDYAKTKLSSKEYGLKVVSMFYACVFLNDTSHGYPKAALSSFFDPNTDPKFLDSVFQGYAYGLQFLWYNLLTKEEFENSSLKNLHISQKIYGKEVRKLTRDEFYGKFSEDKEDKIRRKVFQKWYTLDNFLSKIRSEVILPMEEKTDAIIKKADRRVFILKKINKSILKEILTRIPPSPEYLKKDDKKSVIKKLDQIFYWYPVTQLDSARTFDYNGVSTFIAMLKGYAQILDEEGSEDGKIAVRIIKHPSSITDGGNDITFAILVGSYGIFSDTSGWLIFFDCATDYSGHGGEMYRKGLDTIRGLTEKNRVESEELTIYKNHFEWYQISKTGYVSKKEARNLTDKIDQEIGEIQQKVDQQAIKIQQDANQTIRRSNAKLFEYVVHRWIRDYYNFDSTILDMDNLDGAQIDCYGKKDHTVELFECKMQLHDTNMTRIIDQLKRQEISIKKRFSHITVIKNAVIYEDISNERKQALEAAGIQVHHGFKHKIRTARIFDNSRRELLSVLDATIQNSKNLN